MATDLETTALEKLSENADRYHAVLKTYGRLSRSCEDLMEWLDRNLPELVVGSTTGDRSENRTLKVLSVGPGDGLIDCKILTCLRESLRNPNICVVAVDPDAYYLQQYRGLVSKESARLQGVNFDWRHQTFQECHANSPDEKFDFISCISSIYFLGDLGESLLGLYNQLDDGGILLIAMMPGEKGFGPLWQSLHKRLDSWGTIYFTSSRVQEECGKQNIPISDVQIIKTHLDVSECFEPPERLSEDGSDLLDFLTHTVSFAQNAPVDLRDDVLGLLASEACSERGPAGEVLLGDSTAVIIIRRQ